MQTSILQAEGFRSRWETLGISFESRYNLHLLLVVQVVQDFQEPLAMTSNSFIYVQSTSDPPGSTVGVAKNDVLLLIYKYA